MSPSSRFEEVLDQLHDDRFRDVVKYVVLHPIAIPGMKQAIGEHPLRPHGPHPTGIAPTWLAALEELLSHLKVLHEETEART